MSEIAEQTTHDVADERSTARIVWDLAWPAITLNCLQVVNSLLDSKFVAAIGPSSLDATGASMNISFFLINLAFALGTAATALVSRFYGAKEEQNMLKAARQCAVFSLIVGGILCVAFIGFIPLAATLFVSKTGPVYAEMMRYLYPLMAGIPAIYVFSVVASSLRAIGDTKRPMYVSGAQIILHIVLNFLLIFPTREVQLAFIGEVTMPGAGLGIAGAGWAFTISAWFAALVYLPVASGTILGSMWKPQLPSWSWFVRIMRIAVPASIQSMIRLVSLAAFMAALQYTKEGESALGALRVGFSMEGIAFMPAFGYMIAASALVGQSLGMRNPERAERLAWSAAHQAALLMGVMSVFFFAFAHHIASVFIDDSVQLKAAVNYLRIIAVTEPLFGYAMVLVVACQGAGDTVRPTIVGAITQIGLRAPLTWLFAVTLNGDATAAWWVMTVTQGVNGLMMIWLFRLGKWKSKKV
jgi:putative MATE family efflux protein